MIQEKGLVVVNECKELYSMTMRWVATADGWGGLGWTGYGGVKKRVGDLGFWGNFRLGNFQNMQPMLA